MLASFHSEEYNRYLRSPAWAAKRRERWEIDDGQCVMCGRPVEGMEAECHHITYKRLGHEDVLADICTLCRDCHKKIHNYYDRRRA